MYYINLGTGKTLVHCAAGSSRSGSIVVAYLMKMKFLTLKEGLSFAKSKRSIIHPNEGFMKQLEIYEKTINLS